MSPTTIARFSLPALLILGEPLGAQRMEEPVGLLMTVGPTTKVIRPGSGSAASARVGDLLFAGDRLRTTTDPASFLFCPSRWEQTLHSQSEVLLLSDQVKIESGKMSSQKQVAVCFLPQAVRLARASQQHFGGLVMREVVPTVQLLSPLGGAVLEARPKFVWESVERADSYRIEVSDPGRRILWSTRLPGTAAQYPASAPPLTDASTYSWKVIASTGTRPISASESSFRVLPAAERAALEQGLAEISAAMAQDPSNLSLQVARATRLERANLLSPALQQYQSLAAVWRDAAWLKAKVFQLQEALRAAWRPARFAE